MEKSKYIEVIDYYNRLLEKKTITRDIALWAMHAVLLCALRDDGNTADDYCYICEHLDRLIE